MPPGHPPHLAEIEQQASAAAGWVARYWSSLESRRVGPEVEPGWVRSQLPASAPERPEALEAILSDLDRVVAPALAHWQHPSFFAFFPANTSAPAVTADLISSGLGVNGMNWATSPAATEVEQHVCDWMVELLGLPTAFRHDSTGGGVIQDSASSATLCALLAARRRRTAGGDLSALRAYTSEHAHSSVLKGARIAGLAEDQVRLVQTDDELAMRPGSLSELVEADRDAGLDPFFVCATVGTTSTMAVDPVREIGDVTSRHDAWLHVDAAMAGVAAICGEHRWVVDGLDRVDSFCTNPHKWLFTTFDCDLFWVAHREALTDALSITPPYLRSERSDVVDYRDWQVPLGRRFRALKLWFVLRQYGAEALRTALRAHIEWAGWLAGRLELDDRFEIVVPARLNLVCFRSTGGDEATDALFEAVNGSGEALLTCTEVAGRPVIRVCVGSTFTERRHVESLWGLLDRLAG